MIAEPCPNKPWFTAIPACGSSTCRPSARPRNCHVSSQTWAIACAGIASPKQASPPLGFTGTRPPRVVAPLRNSSSAPPISQRPMSSYQSSSSAVDRS